MVGPHDFDRRLGVGLLRRTHEIEKLTGVALATSGLHWIETERLRQIAGLLQATHSLGLKQPTSRYGHRAFYIVVGFETSYQHYY